MIMGVSSVSKEATLAVFVSHDKGQKIWHILSSDIPGLNVEAETLDELIGVISDAAPDLIAANLPGTPPDSAINVQHIVNNKPARAA
jgi:hypothetical protein